MVILSGIWTYESLVVVGAQLLIQHICALSGFYTVYSGNSLPTFRETYRSHLQGGPIGFPETSVSLVTVRCVITQKSPLGP